MYNTVWKNKLKTLHVNMLKRYGALHTLTADDHYPMNRHSIYNENKSNLIPIVKNKKAAICGFL